VENIEFKAPDKFNDYVYKNMEKKLGSFHLSVKEGKFTNSQIVVLLGENGTGKTTLINILAGKDPDLKSDVKNINIV